MAVTHVEKGEGEGEGVGVGVGQVTELAELPGAHPAGQVQTMHVALVVAPVAAL